MNIDKEHYWSIGERHAGVSEKERFLLECRIYCINCGISPDTLPQYGDSNYFCVERVGEE